MCALRAHIKLSIFRNIFSRIEKATITFSILKNKNLKIKINVYAHVNKILQKFYKNLILNYSTKHSRYFDDVWQASS